VHTQVTFMMVFLCMGTTIEWPFDG